MSTAYRKIKLRRDTAANLAAVVPTEGEPTYSTDNKQFAVGDGSTAFASLAKMVTAAATLTSNAVALGDGTSKVKVVAGITTDGTSKLVLGVAGTSVGGVDFKNATSGTITLAPVSGALGTVTLSLPAVTDTLVGLAATQTLTNKTLGASTSVTASITFSAGVKQTFAPNSTTAGLNVGSVAGDPSSPANGDLWYDSTAGELTARIAGANVALGAGGGGGGSGTVNTGAASRLAYYPSAGTTVDDADGTAQVIIGTASTSAANGLFAIYGDATNSPSYASRRASADTAAGEFFFSKSRGTIASPTATQSGDTLGRVMFGGYGSSAWQQVPCGIRAEATENFTNAAQGSQLVFMSTIAGGTTREDILTVNATSSFAEVTSSKSVLIKSTNTGLRVDSSNSTLAYLSLTFAGTQKATFGVGGTNDDWIAGSIAGDANLRTHNSLSLNFSTDNGVSIAGRFVASTGQFSLQKNITSTSTTTGTLVVTGGVGISGAVFVGGTLSVTGVTTLTAVKVTTAIRDTNGNDLFVPSATSSAVNQVTVANAATGNGPILSATGSDTNISFNIQSKGSGTVILGNPSFTGNCAFITDANVPYIRWRSSTTTKTITGLAATSNNILTGANTDDFCFRQDANQRFIFSTNASSTIDFTIEANSGGIKCVSPGGGLSDAWKLGNASSTSPTSPNRTVQISVNGVTLYLHAKTSND